MVPFGGQGELTLKERNELLAGASKKYYFWIYLEDNLLSIRVFGEWFQVCHAWAAWKQIIALNKLLDCIYLHALVDQLKSWEQNNELYVRWKDGSNGHPFNI